MTQREWKKPGAASGDGDFFKASEHEGDLLGIDILEYVPNRPHPRFKEKDGSPQVRNTIWADITVFDGDKAGKVYKRAEITMAHVVLQLVEVGVGGSVLGRLSKTFKTQNGKAWELLDPTDEDYELATAGASVGAPAEDDDTPEWAK